MAGVTFVLADHPCPAAGIAAGWAAVLCQPPDHPRPLTPLIHCSSRPVAGRAGSRLCHPKTRTPPSLEEIDVP